MCRQFETAYAEILRQGRDWPRQKVLPERVTSRVELIDGEMVSWYGSRAIEGLRYLKRFREALGVRGEG